MCVLREGEYTAKPRKGTYLSWKVEVATLEPPPGASPARGDLDRVGEVDLSYLLADTLVVSVFASFQAK